MRKYLIESWDDHEDFLEKMAIRTGKLLKVRKPFTFIKLKHKNLSCI